MIRCQLVMALDFAKKKNAPHTRYSYRRGETWYIVQSGPGYSNTSKVIEFDADGLALLESRELKEESQTSKELAVEE